MPYYATGDYYQAGDLLGFFKGIGKAAVGFLSGGPVGAAAAVVPSIGGSRTTRIGLSVPSYTPNITAGTALKLGAAAGGAAAGYMNTRDVPADQQPKGYHLNKSGYFLKSGEYVAPRSRWVKNRTRNPANGRALRRAVGRATSFERLVKRNRKSLRALAKV